MAPYTNQFFSLDPNAVVSNYTGITTTIKQPPKPTMYERFTNLFLSEPEKSFRKADITNSRGELTDEGERVFLAWLLKKNQDAFLAEVVTPLLAEEAKK
jgi:hypothetical protein